MYVAITPLPGVNTSLRESKFLGYPYMPKADTYPIGSHGNPLALLAQLNFSDVPHLPTYPTKGILQFFIDFDELYGLRGDGRIDPNNQAEYMENLCRQGDFVVRYYPEPTPEDSEIETVFEYLLGIEDEVLPVSHPCALGFRLTEEWISPSDAYFFRRFFGKSFSEFCEEFGEHSDQVRTELLENFKSSGSKIGGYARITQSDPRLRSSRKDNWLLLLQVDHPKSGHYPEDFGIMWGDGGAGCFFIREEHLKRCDFSRVAYYWDCA